MKIQLKWLPDIRKRPVPARYACTICFGRDTNYLYSAVVTFPQAIRTLGDVEFLFEAAYIDRLPDKFYITEGGRVVAEAQKIKENKEV